MRTIYRRRVRWLISARNLSAPNSALTSRVKSPLLAYPTLPVTHRLSILPDMKEQMDSKKSQAHLPASGPNLFPAKRSPSEPDIAPDAKRIKTSHNGSMGLDTRPQVTVPRIPFPDKVS